MTDLSWLGLFDRVYALCRVSSKEQAYDRNTIEVQENRLKAIIPKPVHIYKDIISGDNRERPGFNQMLAQVRSDAVDGLKVLVVITEQSRLSREGVDKVSSLIEEFDRLNVCLYALDGGKQTAKEPHEWLARSQEALFNQYFLRQHRRVLRSMKEQRRVELKPVSVRPPKGYLFTREKYIPDPEYWDIVRQAIFNYLPPPSGKGMSLNKCSDWCREKGWKISPQGFKVWMANPILRGHLSYIKGGYNRDHKITKVKVPKAAREYVYNVHDALITEAEYQLIEHRLKDNRVNARRGTNSHRSPLSGLVVCAYCKNKMWKHVAKDKVYGHVYHNFICRNRNCNMRRSVSERKIDLMLREEIAKKATELISIVDKAQTEINPEVFVLEGQIKELESVYLQCKVESIKQAIEELRVRQNKLSHVPLDRIVSEERLAIYKNPDSFKVLTSVELRQAYHELCEKIVVSKEEIQISLFL